MNRKRPLWRALALLAAMALLVAACGDDDDTGAADGGTDTADTADTADGATDGEGTLSELDMSVVSVTVGSKDFTEQLVLGQILIQALEAAGADVTDQTNLGGTQVNRQALEVGQIDAYFEYNGTAWTEHLGNEDPANDPETLTEDVREQDLEQNGIHWLSRSEFNNTYGFATGPDVTEENGGPFDIYEMGEYLAENPDATVCMESEFPDRSDGLVLWEEKGGYSIDDYEVLDTNVIYNETATGGCTFGEIFTTDGRIGGLDLSVVDDDGAMILYNVSLNVRDGVYEQAPEAWDTIAEEILGPLDDETMTELNRRVSIDGEDPAAVAADFLAEQGLV
jgi:osmoprotectant transport system substrate-binding protein